MACGASRPCAMGLGAQASRQTPWPPEPEPERLKMASNQGAQATGPKGPERDLGKDWDDGQGR
jgi:hypothetical protein